MRGGAYFLVSRGLRWSDEVMRTHMNRTAGSRALAVAGVVVLALSLSACGGSKKAADTTTTTSLAATTDWANGVCTAFTDWKTSIQDIKASLTGGNLSSSDLRQAARQAEDATKTLTRTLDNLGTPDVPGIDQAKTNIDALKTSLTANVNVIQSAFAHGQPSTAQLAQAAQEFQKMVGTLTRTVAYLKTRDPSGELGKAVHQAPACKQYF